MDPIALAFIYGLMVTGLTSLGSLFTVLGPRLAERERRCGAGFCCWCDARRQFTSLILPAMERGLYLDVGIGIAMGIALIALMNRVIPHEHAVIGYEGSAKLRGKIRKA